MKIYAFDLGKVDGKARATLFEPVRGELSHNIADGFTSPDVLAYSCHEGETLEDICYSSFALRPSPRQSVKFKMEQLSEEGMYSLGVSRPKVLLQVHRLPDFRNTPTYCFNINSEGWHLVTRTFNPFGSKMRYRSSVCWALSTFQSCGSNFEPDVVPYLETILNPSYVRSILGPCSE